MNCYSRRMRCIVSYKLTISILRQFQLVCGKGTNAVSLFKVFASPSSKLHRCVRFLFNRWFLLYSVFLRSHTYVSMSGQSGIAVEYEIVAALIICVDIII